MPDIIYEPLKFLGATVLSFNCQLGLGASESTLNVDLIEDCETMPKDSFWPQDGSIIVGAPVYFSAGAFAFGGILQNWTYNQNESGKTYTAVITDPRQLLENAVVVTESYLGLPIQAINYFNVYSYWESSVLSGNCAAFGISNSGERGMPYKMIIEALVGMLPIIYSPSGYAFSIDFASFPYDLPDYYRVAGPSISLLQLLQDVCDVTGNEFFVNLLPGNIISIGLINLKNPPDSFSNIIAAYNGTAKELSYGQELRNDITKTVLFGEQQHYMSRVDKFNYFFGEDLINGRYVPVIPYRYDVCGFWISKKIDSLNQSLLYPLPTNGPYTIHELDIRSAMSSKQLWLDRVMSQDISGTFNQAVRDLWFGGKDARQKMKVLENGADALQATKDISNNLPVTDVVNNRTQQDALLNSPVALEELDKIWNFIKTLGETYYGKQFITPLNQKICYNVDPLEPKETKLSDIPTNAGGWVDAGVPVLGLSDPELDLFREEDGRIGCFALFRLDNNKPNEESTTEQKGSFNGYIGDINIIQPNPSIA